MNAKPCNSSMWYILFIVMGLAGFAEAQVRPDTLPRLSPQEVFIPGELQVSFGAIRRQPLTGFAQPARPYEISDARVSPLPPYRQNDIPPSILQRPIKPAALSIQVPTAQRGHLALSGGAFFSRTADLLARFPLSRNTFLFTDVQYDGSFGHQPKDMGTVKAPYDLLDAKVGVRRETANWTLYSAFEGTHRAYTHFGADVTPGSGQRPFPERSVQRAAGMLDVSGNPSEAVTLSVYSRYTIGRSQTALLSPPGSSDLVHTDYDWIGRASVEVPWVYLDAEASLTTASDWANTQTLLAGTGLHQRSGTTHLRVGVRAIIAERGATRRTAFAPDAYAQISPMDGVLVRLSNIPEVQRFSLPEILDLAPYSIPSPDALPAVFGVNAKGQIEVGSDPFQVTVNTTFKRSEAFPFLEQVGVPGYRANFLKMGYGAGSHLSVGTELRAFSHTGLHASLAVAWNRARLEQNDAATPYIPALQSSISAGYAPDGSAGRIAATLHLLGERTTSRTDGDPMAPTYARFDVTGSWRFSPLLEGTARLRGAVPGMREEWLGYPEAAVVPMIGLTVRW